jgi:hypothetical protein
MLPHSQVMHPHIPASDITYLVVEPPIYGYLEVLSSQGEAEEDPGEVEESRPAPVTLFDQSLIDDKRVHYIQSTANQTKDMFVVDVTNGISWLQGESTVITSLFIIRFKANQILWKWMRLCATSRKVVGSIPNEIGRFFNWLDHSSHAMALRPTQPLTEISTRNLPGCKEWLECKAQNLAIICELVG